MTKSKAWISALRPRTLFLAAAAALCGNGIAYSCGRFSPLVCVLTFSIAIILQLLSNLANDLGDYEHGTDITGERVGPTRSVQSGVITPKQMKLAIKITIVIASLVGLGLIYIALLFLSPFYILLFILLGLASIVAAIKYTGGSNPYGYKGFGDIFSFIFFGPVAIVGTYFLHTHTIDFQPWLPAIGIGLLTVAVLNINNMRDMENDRKSGKVTVACILGFKNAKRYHALLTFGSFFSFLAYNVTYTSSWQSYIYLLVFILFFKILWDIAMIIEHRLLDPYLKYTSMSTFLLSIAFVICINL